MAKKTQKQRILNDLKNGCNVTPMDALRDHGCFRLAAVIHDLRKDGHVIKHRHNGKRWASYYLESRNLI